MDLLTSSERRALKARAHALRPVVMISEAGLGEGVLAEIHRSLAAHELIKIRVLGAAREARQALLAEVCARTGARPVQHIGRMLVIWRPNPPQNATPESISVGWAAKLPAGARVRTR